MTRGYAFWALTLLGWLTLPAFSQDVQTAPLNPAFVAYTQAIKEKGVAQAKEATGLNFGWRPGPVDLSHLKQPQTLSASLPEPLFDTSYDLRTLGYLTAVRNQGSYGTCWAHATYSSMESCLLKNTGTSYNFSENNLANLHGFDWGFDDGGNAYLSMAYLSRWNGPVNETSDPYPNPGGSSVLPPVKHVMQVMQIPSKTSATGNTAIKQALLDYGAVYVNYYHNDSYYNSTYKSYYFNGSSGGNHAVAIVGWDDSYSSSKFNTTPAGNGAYIVRNSWGTSWGESGYFYVSYYDTTFAWGELNVFMNAEPTSTYSKVYQYDPLGWVTSLGVGTTTMWGANIFTASATERLGAVGFYAPALSTAYIIYVYTGVTAGSPSSGTLALTQSGTCPFAGYVSVPLSQTVPVTSGSLFSIVVKFTTPSYNYPLCIEYAVADYSSAATAASGQSFYSTSGSIWYDLTGWNSTANCCIKGYVPTDQTQPTVTINQAAGQPDPTNGAPVNFTVVFSEAVTNFATGDVTISGTASGTKTATVTGSGSTYNVAVTGMTGSGTVIASIAASKATDLVGNPNVASTSTDNTVTYDIVAPTVTINQAAGQPDPTNTAPIHFTVVFSESVSGFATGDVTLGGTAGATTATVTGSGTTYDVAVSGMTGDGTVIASVGSGKAKDAAGNNNAASTSTDNTVTYSQSTSQGTPYAWLDLYGLVSGGNYESAATDDVDGDGMTAWQEYVVGTVPTNPASVFRSVLVDVGGQPGLHWTPDLTGAVPARVYSVYGAANLLSGFSPSPISNNIPAGTPLPLQAFSTNRFFKVGVQIP